MAKKKATNKRATTSGSLGAKKTPKPKFIGKAKQAQTSSNKNSSPKAKKGSTIKVQTKRPKRTKAKWTNTSKSKLKQPKPSALTQKEEKGKKTKKPQSIFSGLSLANTVKVAEALYKGEDVIIDGIDTSKINVGGLTQNDLRALISAVRANKTGPSKKLKSLLEIMNDPNEDAAVREIAKDIYDEYEEVAKRKAADIKSYTEDEQLEWFAKIMKFDVDEPSSKEEIRAKERNRSAVLDPNAKYGGLVRDPSDKREVKMFGRFMEMLRNSSPYILYYDFTDDSGLATSEYKDLWDAFRQNYSGVKDYSSFANTVLEKAYNKFREASVKAGYGKRKTNPESRRTRRKR